MHVRMQGRIQGEAHPARAPPKIGKNMIFLRKIVIFHTKYPNNFRASLRSAQNPGSAPTTLCDRVIPDITLCTREIHDITLCTRVIHDITLCDRVIPDITLCDRVIPDATSCDMVRVMVFNATFKKISVI